MLRLRSAQRFTSLSHAKGGTTLADYDWTYDVGNRLTQFDSLTDGTVDYSYDARQQLTGADYDYQSDESFTYDDNGNRTNTGYSTGDDNRLLSDGTLNYLYDDEGNRIRKTSISSGDYTEYAWDQRNRLIQVVHKNSSGTVLQTLDYTYDIFDRRIGKSDTPPSGPALTEQFVYDGEHVALRFEGGQLANRYLHGPAVDQILADEQVSSPSTAGDVLWPLTDNLGTVRDLAEYNAGTDVTTIANHIAYDAFGQRTSETNSAVDHLFGYTSRDWDEDADLQYNRARWYDPATGRWMSQDPIGFNAGDANLFRYVDNLPTTFLDPEGLSGIGIGVPVSPLLWSSLPIEEKEWHWWHIFIPDPRDFDPSDLVSPIGMVKVPAKGAAKAILGGIRSLIDPLPGRIGKTGPIKVVPDEQSIDDLFSKLTKGGKPAPSGTYPGIVIEMPDGSIVRKRPGSKSGGPTIDITLPDGTITKVHCK